MKRAEPSLTKWVMGPCFMAVICAMTLSDSMAQTARFTIIDARDGMTAEVVDAYAEAMDTNADTPIVNRHIKIIASTQHGFNADAIVLPEHVRDVETKVSVHLRQGSTVQAPIRVNELTVSRRAPQRIQQTTDIRGH